MKGSQVIVGAFLGGDMSIRHPVACKIEYVSLPGRVLKSPVMTTGISEAKAFILSTMSSALFCRETSDW